MLALRLFWRDWRSGELRLLAAALVIAVATVTAITSFADRLQRALVRESATFLAADRVIEGSRPIPPQWQAEAEQRGLATATTLEFLSMVFAAERARLGSVKAVDDAYPLRGQLEVAEVPFGTPVPVRRGPRPGEVWLESRLLPALAAAPGELLEVGVAELPIARVLVREPDRSGGPGSIAPRVMLHMDDVAATGVIQPGSRLEYRLLLAGDEAALAEFDEWMAPRASAEGFRYYGVRDGIRDIGEALARAERFLLLGGLLAVLLAGLAIALAARRYAVRHLDHIAILKSLGATPRRIDGLFLMLLAVLLVSATAVGLAVGSGVQVSGIWLLGALLEVDLPAPGWRAARVGLLTAALCLFAFAAPPLLRLRNVSPLRVIRRDFDGTAWREGMACGCGCAGLVVLLLWYSTDVRLALLTLGGIVGTALLFGLLAWVLLRSGRAVGLAAGGALHLALSGMQRRSADSVMQMLAFGVGILLLLVLVLIRSALVEEWRSQLPDDAPNHFAINIAPHEVAPLQQALRGADIASEPLFPMIRGRIAQINGVDAQQHVAQQGDAARRAPAAPAERNLTWAAELPDGNTVIDGRWWSSAAERGVSVEAEWAMRNGIGLGDELAFLVQAQPVVARVMSIRRVDWDTLQPNFFVIFSPGVLEGFNPMFMTSFHLSAQRKAFLNDFLRDFPTVTVIEVDALIEQVQQIIDYVTTAIELVLALVLVACALVLLASIQASMDERMHQQAVIRTLGASRRLVLGSLFAEFAALGLGAGLLAACGAELTAWLLQTQVFELEARWHGWVWLAGPLAGVLVVGSVGLLATRRLVSLPPLVMLRGL